MAAKRELIAPNGDKSPKNVVFDPLWLRPPVDHVAKARDGLCLRRPLRCTSMDAFFFPNERHAIVDLYGLGYRCLHEPASRRLDGEIYCAIHNVSDRNPLISHELVQSREKGEVLVEHYPNGGLTWIEVPAFTAELNHAESLLPEGLTTLFCDARRVCATALQARALADEPPLVSNIVELRRS